MPAPNRPTTSSPTPSPKPHGTATFRRNLRLLDGKQFSAVFDHKKCAHGSSFATHIAPNELGHPRIGLAVSKRVSKKAVERNRIKRIIRESFRQHQHTLGEFDYIVTTKTSAGTKTNHALREELDLLWGKARKKCEHY